MRESERLAETGTYKGTPQAPPAATSKLPEGQPDPAADPYLTNANICRPPQLPEGEPNPAADPAPTKIPERIGRYRIEKVLGKGGFGLVYLAHDENLTRQVAIKVPHPERVSHPEDAQAYLAEARTVANLDHPHIVPVYDVGSTPEFPVYVVSKFVDGGDLAAALKHSRKSFHETAEFLATVAEAVHYAHKQGLFHRDLKPANILLDKAGRPFVVDFGLALRERDVGQGSRYVGTPAYMSPEQARGEGHRIDGRSDIFSLGVVLYEMLAGRRPFHGKNREELLEQISTRDVPPPRQVEDSIPKELERICLKALSKRAADRYTTARDLAEDLRAWLATTPESEPGRPASGQALVDTGVTPLTPQTTVTTPHGTDAAKPQAIVRANPALDSRPIKIVPKGLRSFDEHDADFFLELLPGPRDRDGLPDSIRFWKTRIEETDADKTFSVGLIYGPSGCGKSSLVKAGLLPRLSENVIAVYLEATAEETEIRLLNGLRKRCPALRDDLGLKETLAALRLGQGAAQGKKVLIVLDQFEQWLHAKKERQNTELVQALRQCDGERVQCVVMVRDDFWLAVSRFLNELEADLVQGKNFALTDLFDPDHTRRVLAAFGRAFGRLPENMKDTSTGQKEFLTQTVTGLAEDGKVISVRLALFAEMMKGKPWTPTSLKEVGGTSGVGVTFLEETFSANTNPRHRLHQKAARAVLHALLPESGTDIKGHMRSSAELLEASGYASRPRDFHDLIRMLDSEIRLITPTDPEGNENEEGEPGGGHRFEENWSPRILDDRYYQLTHDYLVPSLRHWLTHKQKETRRGRAELRLAERAALWQAKPENRHLPSWWEYLTAVWLVPAKNCTAVQQKMLRKAGRVHAVRWGSALVILLTIGLGIWNVVSSERQNSLRGQVATAVDAVQNSAGPIVSYGLRDLRKLPSEMVLHELKSRYNDAEVHRKLGLAYALADNGEPDAPFLCSQIQHSAPDEVDNFVPAFRQARDASLDAIHAFAKVIESKQDWRLKVRLAVVALHLADDRIAADMCRIDERPDPVQRTMFIDEFSAWHGDVAQLAVNCQKLSDPGLRSAVCMAIGSLPPDQLTTADTDAWKPLFKEWFQSAPDNVTHSAAGWALRQWKSEVSVVSAPSKPSENHKRFVNSLGMSMLKILPGKFERANGNVRQTVKLTRAFFLGDREASVDQFQKCIDDPVYPKEDKPADWQPGKGAADPAGDHPREKVSWYDAVLFCNWLSRKEGFETCYERTGKKEKGSVEKQEFDEWRLSPNATGYRLPTEAEWEYACRAGTTTDFACGTDADLLRKYAVYRTGTTEGAAACGSKLPNGWGLFDMHGNIWEWCHDRYGLYGEGEVNDSAGGSAEGSLRVLRGGKWDYDAALCRSGARDGYPAVSRYVSFGFRVALGSVR